jgi:preprotein translocase subunit Sec63
MGKMSSGFNTPEVKKAYRSLSRKYHPDRTRKLPEEEQEGAKAKFLEITRAHEALTNQEKFDNWIAWGNPEGSLM